MLSINNNNMFKQSKKVASDVVVEATPEVLEAPVTEVIEEVVETPEEVKCDANTDFLKTINHPAKLILATGLLTGENPEALYNDYGKIRVMEMQKLIESYQSNPERYLRSHGLAGCKTCGR